MYMRNARIHLNYTRVINRPMFVSKLYRSKKFHIKQQSLIDGDSFEAV